VPSLAKTWGRPGFPALRIWKHVPSFHKLHADFRQGFSAGLKSTPLVIQFIIEFFFKHQKVSMHYGVWLYP
jgi:hypothetical protein